MEKLETAMDNETEKPKNQPKKWQKPKIPTPHFKCCNTVPSE